MAGQAVSITTDKTAYGPLEPIDLTIRLKNVGKEDVRRLVTDPLLEYKLTVLLANVQPFLTRDGHVDPAKTRRPRCAGAAALTR